MKEILNIEDKSKAIGCKFKIDELNTVSNINLILYKYNDLQRTKARLQEARQSVRLLEGVLKQKEEEFRMLEPLVELTFESVEKEWESTSINGAIINKSDYRNTNI